MSHGADLPLYDVTFVTQNTFTTPQRPEPGDSTALAAFDSALAEDQGLMAGLESKGYRVQRIAWDAEDFDWSRTKFVVIRGTFDYIDRVEKWERWVKTVAKVTTLLNPPELVLWNMNKRYLVDLQRSGINVPDLLVVEPGQSIHLKDLHAQKGWKYAVIKPAISADARNTYKVNLACPSEKAHGEKLLQRLLGEKEMVVQEFQENIAEGELSLICIDGEVVHAILKVPQQGDFRVQHSYGGSTKIYTPSVEETNFARSIFKSLPAVPTYARVDILKDNRGSLCVMELELIEPYLWLQESPKAVERFVSAIERRL